MESLPISALIRQVAIWIGESLKNKNRPQAAGGYRLFAHRLVYKYNMYERFKKVCLNYWLDCWWSKWGVYAILETCRSIISHLLPPHNKTKVSYFSLVIDLVHKWIMGLINLFKILKSSTEFKTTKFKKQDKRPFLYFYMLS